MRLGVEEPWHWDRKESDDGYPLAMFDTWGMMLAEDLTDPVTVGRDIWIDWNCHGIFHIGQQTIGAKFMKAISHGVEQ